MRTWTFGQKIGAGFAVTVLLAIAVGGVAVYALHDVVAAKDHVIMVNAPLLLDAERFKSAVEWKVAATRGFFLTGDQEHLTRAREAQAEYERLLIRLKGAVQGPERRRVLETAERTLHEYEAATDKVVAMRTSDSSIEAVATAFEEQVMPKRLAMRAQLEEFVDHESGVLEAARQASSETASSTTMIVTAIVIAITLFAPGVAVFLTWSLTRQIGTAVGQVQSSSTELEAAANQQASGAREQAGAMNEINTTITELLATSRQIAESGQRVAQIAEETARAAGAGEGTVETAHQSIAAIHAQVNVIVNHMLDLGKKSQEIGAVLDIVSELAEQTNILAINATIEAAGAGEAGKRFMVVAEEIRKLADRVTSSTKEIRGLIDVVRGAVNTTVMATESGSKVVDAGSRQFSEVASAFREIAALVATTTEAAREIELSTKQQATAVEQVKLAVADVAQATRETEASSGQTSQTASQLAGLSHDLLRLVRARTAATA